MISRINRWTLLAVMILTSWWSVQAQDQTEIMMSIGSAQQGPKQMHVAMDQRPCITVGQKEGDLIGHDNRVLQAAVDYIAGLGGGTVVIGPGTFLMRDSLHVRSGVTIKGSKGKTILRKVASVESPLLLDGDFGEQQFTVADSNGFAVGRGVAIWDDRAGGFHTTVARITGQRGNTFSIDKPLMADCMVANKARAATVFPVVSVYHAEGVRIEDVVIDGNKDHNVPLNGCRGAGIFMYGAHGAVISGCHIRGYNGDGISFQQSNDVTVQDCISEDNTSLGLHPGSGSQRPTIRRCVARDNGTDGLFLCWRVKRGLFEDNLLEQNKRFGISIGHKDSDNILRNNTIRENEQNGIFFRNESLAMAPHRNLMDGNVIENNRGAQIRIRGYVQDLVFKNNTIRASKNQEANGSDIAFLVEETVGPIVLQDNTIEAKVKIDDRRPANQR